MAKTPTLSDIKSLAEQLGVTFSGSEQQSWFDLDRDESPSLNGTYQNTTLGIAAAYDDLERHQMTMRSVS